MSAYQVPMFPEDGAQVDILAEFTGKDGWKAPLIKINRAALKQKAVKGQEKHAEEVL